MKFSKTEGQNDFLEAAALQKLIIAAMKEATATNPQELAALLKQISQRHRSANSYVRSEVVLLMQELKELVGDFEYSTPIQPVVKPTLSRSKPGIKKAVFAGCIVAAILSAIGFETVRRSTAIAPSSNQVENSTSACTEINPDRVMIEGYYRHDGTYVRGHERTVPNHTKADNINCRRR
ncbi:hypothetical protein ACQ4M3_36500 [Leptolyngbya sp. AN03gr2]|uniref:hypothetical protein n=1 Tax=unclassified Leptolyngbya TaxID=2650499 RepID=UPI003D316ECC